VRNKGWREAGKFILLLSPFDFHVLCFPLDLSLPFSPVLLLFLLLLLLLLTLTTLRWASGSTSRGVVALVLSPCPYRRRNRKENMTR